VNNGHYRVAYNSARSIVAQERAAGVDDAKIIDAVLAKLALLANVKSQAAWADNSDQIEGSPAW
jgi:hypothetical protein